MQSKKFTKEDIKEIIEMHTSKNKISEISKKYKCYPQVIQNLLKKEIGYIPERVKTKNIRYFQSIDSNLKAYFLGFIAADGAIVKNELTISIHRKDIQILEKLKNELQSPNKIISLKKENTDMVRFSVGNKFLKMDLENIGITERKTFTLQDIIKNIPKNFRKSFILGYFDGDGSFTFKGRKGLMDIRGTQSLLRGFSEELKIPQENIKQYDSTFCIRIWKQSEIKRVFELLYFNQSFFLHRKYSKFKDYIKTIYGQEETISSSEKDVRRSCQDYRFN